jgi:hypothetical protein
MDMVANLETAGWYGRRSTDLISIQPLSSAVDPPTNRCKLSLAIP